MIKSIIGIDVSKAKIDVLWLRDIESGKVKTKVFNNTEAGHQELTQWIETHTKQPITASHVIMEATGVYHEALAYALYQAGASVSVVNPAKISHYAKSLGVRSKTDKKDSLVIARYGATQAPPLWSPEPEAIRELKALMNRFNAVEKDIQREKNRLEKAEISRASAFVITSIERMLESLHQEKNRLDHLIKQHIDQDPKLKHNKELLETIPGVGEVIARHMCLVLGSRTFQCASQCAAFLGLIPVQHESGSSIKGRSRLSKAGDATVRAKLYMAAVVSIRHNPDIKRQYERLLKNGKSKLSAIGAAMRKLVHICFGVLKHQTPYQVQTLEN